METVEIEFMLNHMRQSGNKMDTELVYCKLMSHITEKAKWKLNLASNKLIQLKTGVSCRRPSNANAIENLKPLTSNYR